MNNCFLAIGTNLGERHLNIDDALSFISCFSLIVQVSSMLENPAIVPENAPQSWNVPFINIVIHIKTDFSVFQIFAKIKEIENKMGRDFSADRWSPRIIDIDIILFNNLVISSANLTVPHSQMYRRNFVLKPLCEIAPNVCHPILHKSISDLLFELSLHL